MFTGIIEELGEVLSIEDLGDSARIRLRGPLTTADAHEGQSIAVNGVCLTVLDTDAELAARPGEFSADVMRETLERSSLAALAVGSRVNLERAMALGARLGGHLVQGHVDGTAELLSRTPGEAGADGDPQWEVLRFSLPAHLSRYLVEKGSITVDGISLTVVEAARDSFTVSLIPATLTHTTLGSKGIGEPANLEVDVIAKYVERMLTDRAFNLADGSIGAGSPDVQALMDATGRTRPGV
jgi:riboflavin synthase